MKFVKSVFLILIILPITILAGCSAKVHITSMPSGATITLNDEYKGKTPITFTVADPGTAYAIYVFEANLQGYQTETKVYKEGLMDKPTNTIPGHIHFDLEEINQPKQQIPKKISYPKSENSMGYKNNWAIIVGISKYQHTGQNGLTNLIFADDDAIEFSRSLRNLGWSESHIKLLTNEEATQRNIMIALEAWLSKAGPNDQIILFWAGHGFPDPEDPEKVYFACYDTDISIPVTGYRMDKVRNALEERKSKNVIILADTCHAGKLITRGVGGISIIPQIEKLRREEKIPKGWIFMVGADTDRQAIEHTSWKNGAFTHSLIKGLSGEADGFQSAGMKDGKVTMSELKDYMIQLLNESPIIRENINTDYVNQLITEHLEMRRNHNHVLWGMMNVSIWQNRFKVRTQS